MPVSWTTIFRLLVVLVVAAHIFFMYCLARVMQDVVGHDAVTVAQSGLFALAMLIPLVWAIVLPDLPEIIRRQLGRRRWSQGRCGTCGYVIVGIDGAACPECGTPRREPEAFRFGWATVTRFVVLALAAWIIGAVGAQVWISTDEVRFAAEARASETDSSLAAYSRPRRWPMRDSRLYYSPDDGVSTYPPNPLPLARPAWRGP